MTRHTYKTLAIGEHAVAQIRDDGAVVVRILDGSSEAITTVGELEGFAAMVNAVAARWRLS